MKQWTREQIMKGLMELVSEITHLKTSEEFGLKKGGIWTTGAENGWIFKGLPPFNYNLEYGEILVSEGIGDTDPKHKGMKVKELYLCGIHREIYSGLEERGWYPKWYDGGTLFFWKNTGKHETDSLKDIQNHPEGDRNDVSGEVLRRLNERIREWRLDVPEKKGKKTDSDRCLEKAQKIINSHDPQICHYCHELKEGCTKIHTKKNYYCPDCIRKIIESEIDYFFPDLPKPIRFYKMPWE